MNDIAIYGAGGFGKEIACLIYWINEVKPQWNLIGFFDDGVECETQISHYGKVLGGMDTLNSWNKSLSVVFAIANNKVLRKLSSLISNTNVQFPNIIAPNIVIKDVETFKIGKGNIIQGGCVVSCDVIIGDFNIFNGAVVLGHDVKIGDYNVLMPSVRISGEMVMGDCNFFGVGSIVLQQLKIKNDTKLAAGSVLMTKPKEGNVYLGVPAKVLKL